MVDEAHFPDVFEVTYRFADNPLHCVADTAARNLLREQDFGWRPWVGKYLDQRPRTADRWREKYWDGLAQYLEQLVDSALCPQFADLLVGYLLVTENESPGRTQHPFVTTGITRKTSLPVSLDAKSVKRLRRILGPLLTSKPQRKTSLQFVINSIFVEKLVESGISRKDACEYHLPKIWASVGIKVRESFSASVLRMDRRYRHKT